MSPNSLAFRAMCRSKVIKPSMEFWTKSALATWIASSDLRVAKPVKDSAMRITASLIGTRINLDNSALAKLRLSGFVRCTIRTTSMREMLEVAH